MSQDKETLALLTHLIQYLNDAAGLAMMIKTEFEENGTDSLANIDFGALLNTNIKLAESAFRGLDRKGLFTAGMED